MFSSPSVSEAGYDKQINSYSETLFLDYTTDEGGGIVIPTDAPPINRKCSTTSSYYVCYF